VLCAISPSRGQPRSDFARDLGDTGPDIERRFEYGVTYDRELAIAAATALTARITA
jgi:hypothetical protein